MLIPPACTFGAIWVAMVIGIPPGKLLAAYDGADIASENGFVTLTVRVLDVSQACVILKYDGLFICGLLQFVHFYFTARYLII